MKIATQIRDIMVPLDEYPKVAEHSTLRDAFAALREGFAGGRRYRHLLVLDGQGQLSGILGIRDILRGLFPDYLRTGEAGRKRHDGPVSDVQALTLVWAETCHEQCPIAAARPVRDFMAPVVATVIPDDPITKAAYLMVSHDQSMLPVADAGRLVGVVRMNDVFDVATEVVFHE